MEENRQEGMNDLSKNTLEINQLAESFAKERTEFENKIDQQNQRIDILQQSIENLLQRMEKMEICHNEVKHIVEKQGQLDAVDTEKLGHVDLNPNENLQRQTTDFNKNIIDITVVRSQNEQKLIYNINSDQPVGEGKYSIENIERHSKKTFSVGQKLDERILIELEQQEEVNLHENEAESVKEREVEINGNEKIPQLETAIKNLTQEITNLKEFAHRISKLHSTLSQPEVSEKAWAVSYLHKEDYNKKTDIQKWNRFLENLKASNTNDCQYLKELNDTILRYGNLVYSNEWRWRLLRLSTAMEVGQFLGNFIKIGAIIHIKNISVKVFTKLKDFNKEILNGNWNRLTHYLATYVDEDEKFFRVALKVDGCQRVSILHWHDERKRKELPKDGRFVLVDEHYSVLGYRMLEVEF